MRREAGHGRMTTSLSVARDARFSASFCFCHNTMFVAPPCHSHGVLTLNSICIHQQAYISLQRFFFLFFDRHVWGKRQASERTNEKNKKV